MDCDDGLLFVLTQSTPGETLTANKYNFTSLKAQSPNTVTSEVLGVGPSAQEFLGM